MKDRKNDMADMQNLAETGWKQMHQTLREKGLSDDVAELKSSSKKRNIILFVVAGIIFMFIISHPLILNESSFQISSSENKIKKPVETQVQPAQLENSDSQNIIHTPTIPFEQKQLLHQRINKQFNDHRRERLMTNYQSQKSHIIRKLLFEKNFDEPVILSADLPIETTKKYCPDSSQKKPTTPVRKPLRAFAGVGANVSAANNHSNAFQNELNIHPGITIIFPLSNKLSFHTGLWALSTIHGKEASAKEKELVNNFNSNIYYNIKTTSIVKASYFDVPMTLHYSISRNWSVGSGLQLSKLYKVNIKEQYQSYDYNNALYLASSQQFNSTPARAIAVFHKKIDIKKFETRFVAETNFETGKFIFTGGYYYGLGKTISIKDADNIDHQYRNIYFKLGIQYQIK